MKIDLHCHTLKCKKGDPITRIVSPELFYEKINDAQVEIVAITNHNFFDIKQFYELRNIVSEICDVWPGVELDVCRKSKGHIIVLADPENVEEFNNLVNTIIGGSNPDDFCIDLEKILPLLEKIDVVIAAHYYKDKALCEEDIKYIEENFSKKERFLRETKRLTSLGIITYKGKKCIIGSDVRDWKKYEENTFAELKYDISGFKNFLKLLDKDIPFINNLIDKDFFGKILVYGNASKKEYPFMISIYNDVNIIFGDKGSGKSEILKSLKNYFEMNYENVVFYEGNNKEKWFKELLKTEIKSNMVYELVEDDLENDFDWIINFTDANLTNITEYTKYFRNLTKNKKSKKIKINEQSTIVGVTFEKYENLRKQYKDIKEFINKIDSFDAIKMDEKLRVDVMESIKLLKNRTYELLCSEWIKIKAIELSNKTITKINKLISELVGAPVRPQETGFFNFAIKRIKIRKIVRNILDELRKEKVRESIFIGEIGTKGRGFIEEKLGFVNSENLQLIENCNIYGNKTSLKKVINCFQSLLNMFISGNFLDAIQSLKQLLVEENIKSLQSFLYLDRKFKLNGEEYLPSSGEKSILSMQYELINNEAKVYLLDEPEANLGSFYIEENIVPLINKLAKMKKIIVIVTHDANIAIRTYPVTSILKVTDNKLYRTFQGSMFTNKLLDISDENCILCWIEESQKYLEGGEKAFFERGVIYEKN